METAVFGNQGRRDHMEDFVHVEFPFMDRPDWLYAGVFDGHSGEAAARRASEELHGLLAAKLDGGEPVMKALDGAFRALDEALAEDLCGTTATALVFVPNGVVVANVGDSEAFLVSRDGTSALTTLHRIRNEGELRRVVAAGARIVGSHAFLPSGKGLMTTRSLGDHNFRDIGIVPEPDIAVRPLGALDEWVVAATDGVWDVMGPQDLGRLIATAETAEEAADRVVETVLPKSGDNVSGVVVRLVRLPGSALQRTRLPTLEPTPRQALIGWLRRHAWPLTRGRSHPPSRADEDD